MNGLEKRKPRFVIVTRDFSGMGFALMIKNAGYDVVMAYKFDLKKQKENLDSFKLAGKNMIDRIELDKINWREYRDAYIFFDQNHWHEVGDALKKDGFKVWGGTSLCYKMEHDRNFGVALAKKGGIDTPPTFEFDSLKDGLDFLDKNPETAYVFKPNDQVESWDTFVPDSDKAQSANEELYAYMQALPDQAGGFILQEKKYGVETNFEVWVNNGKPIFAFCDLECKKKLDNDYGCLVGGAQDVAFTLDLEAKGIRETCLALLTKNSVFRDYTGFLDMNIIVSEKENYFLEFCARTGYPAHPTLFTALAKRPFPEILIDMLEGRGDLFESFKYGFAAGITLYTDKPRKGMPLYIGDQAEKAFYHYDSYKRDGMLLTAGSEPEVGVITGHGYTIKSAAEDALKNKDRINFPNRSSRTDLDKNCYPSAPQGRYDALRAMGYLD